ncbi:MULTISPECIES: hypothetical protein [Bacillus cereus group]|nr:MULTISPECIES: hypothetical protein [Bacillus cereus group]MED1512422.1 hypothetical protein [Bacillus proteolyticus]
MAISEEKKKTLLLQGLKVCIKVGTAFKDILVDVVSETVKKSLWS